MKKFAPVLAIAFALAACGDTDDASIAAEAETVEMPADEAMAGVTEEPAADADANATAAATEAPTDAATATAEQAGENAADVAARAQEAAEAAEAATEPQ